MPKYLPAGLTPDVLNIFSKTSPPYHVTQDNVLAPLQKLEVETITGGHSVRGRGDVIALLYKTHWVGLCEPSWSRKWTSTSPAPTFCVILSRYSDQHHQTIRLYRRMRISAAQRELSRNNREHFLAPGYACVTRAENLRRYRDTVLPKEAHL